jgi:hypothetical protein
MASGTHNPKKKIHRLCWGNRDTWNMYAPKATLPRTPSRMFSKYTSSVLAAKIDQARQRSEGSGHRQKGVGGK